MFLLMILAQAMALNVSDYKIQPIGFESVDSTAVWDAIALEQGISAVTLTNHDSKLQMTFTLAPNDEMCGWCILRPTTAVVTIADFEILNERAPRQLGQMIISDGETTIQTPASCAVFPMNNQIHMNCETPESKVVDRTGTHYISYEIHSILK